MNVILYIYCFIGTDRPALKYLNRHVRTDIATVWYDIGMELLDPRDEQELYVIKNSSSKDMVKCTEMFELWLRRKPNASWNSLIEAFRAPGIELGTLASKIESMLSKGMYIYVSHIMLYQYQYTQV